MKIKLSDFILEQAISDASVDDIIIEQLSAEVDVCLALMEAYFKQYKMQVVEEAAAPASLPPQKVIPQQPQTAVVGPAVPGKGNENADYDPLAEADAVREKHQAVFNGVKTVTNAPKKILKKAGDAAANFGDANQALNNTLHSNAAVGWAVDKFAADREKKAAGTPTVSTFFKLIMSMINLFKSLFWTIFSGKYKKKYEDLCAVLEDADKTGGFKGKIKLTKAYLNCYQQLLSASLTTAKVFVTNVLSWTQEAITDKTVQIFDKVKLELSSVKKTAERIVASQYNAFEQASTDIKAKLREIVEFMGSKDVQATMSMYNKLNNIGGRIQKSVDTAMQDPNLAERLTQAISSFRNIGQSILKETKQYSDEISRMHLEVKAARMEKRQQQNSPQQPLQKVGVKDDFDE